jgi:hypothetical protein
MNHIFKVTSLAGLCFLFNSLGAQTKNKSTIRVIEIQNGDTIRNETIITDSEADHDPENNANQSNNRNGYNYNYNYNSNPQINADQIEKEMEQAMKEMEKGLKELENLSLNIDLSDIGRGFGGFLEELEKLSDISIDTKTKKRFGKKSTEITVRGPKGNNRIIIIDKKGNVKTKKEFDKKKAKEYELKEKMRAQEKALRLQEEALRKQQKQAEIELEMQFKNKNENSGSRAPRFMMSTDDNKVYNFEIETESEKEVEIEIKDKNDKLLLKEIEPRGKKFERKIDLGKFGPGTYTIKLTQDGKEISNHVIVIGE